MSDERLLRTEHVGQLLLRAAEALEGQNWSVLRDMAQEAAREARCLILMEKQEAKENG